jgi:hypothetical protein
MEDLGLLYLVVSQKVIHQLELGVMEMMMWEREESLRIPMVMMEK